MSASLPVTTVPLRPLGSAEYPEKVYVEEQQNDKPWYSRITAMLATPPPGLKWVRMSLDVWKCLRWLVGWVIYLIVGASIMMNLAEEHYQGEIPHPDWKKFKELLTAKANMEGMEDLNIDLEGSLELKQNLMKICNHSFINQTFPHELQPAEVRANVRNEMDHWNLQSAFGDVEWACKEGLFSVGWIVDYDSVPTFIDAIHYTMTALTTIGYGHISPMKTSGQMFCVFYCLFGIPFTFILLNNFADLIASIMLNAYKKVLRGHATNEAGYLVYIVTAFLVLIGFIILMFLPAIAFMYIEHWTYSASFYYTFITLSTIGFGDYYAGFNEYSGFANNTHPLITLYKVIFIIWVMTGLGYWLTVIQFLVKAKSKTTASGQVAKTPALPPTITEQATTFRDLVYKVRNESKDTTVTNAMNKPSPPFTTVDLMNDAEGSRTGDDNDEQPIIASSDKNEDTKDEEPDLVLSLSQLLSVKVVICNDEATVMKNINIITHPSGNVDKIFREQDNIPEKITLSLRDALNLVFSYQE